MPATVLVGCYERFLFGFEADVDAEVRDISHCCLTEREK